MRLLSARLIIALVVGVILVSLCSSEYEVLCGKRTLRRDLQRRAEVLGESLAGNVEKDMERGAFQTLRRTVQRFANRENLIGLAVYDPQGHVIAVTNELESRIPTTDLQAEIEAEAGRINWRFQKDKWKPIVLLDRQHSHKEIYPYYKTRICAWSLLCTME